MPEDLMQYDRLVKDALREVVRAALAKIAEHGLPGNHHFYIGFRTNDPGVEIPDYLKAKYPDEMTIVLQHQFWRLETEGDAFSITLSFNRRHERLVVPYRSLTSFYDPSVQFGLQFKLDADDQASDPGAGAVVPVAADEQQSMQDEKVPGEGEDEDASGKVVTLDQFRKK